MASFFKLEIAEWNVGTDNLSLEQEAAYLRIVNMIRLYEQPLKHNLRVLCGLWRCNERKAKRLLQELIDAKKITIEGDLIVNEKAVEDASNLRQSRVDKASAGRAGGIESGKVRRKALETNDQDEAPASTREDKTRLEKTREDSPLTPQGGNATQSLFPEDEKPKSRRKTQFPDGWKPDADLQAWAIAKGFSEFEVRRLAERCVNHHRSKGNTFADHRAAFRTWVGNEENYRADRRPAQTGGSNDNLDGVRNIIRRINAAHGAA